MAEKIAEKIAEEIAEEMAEVIAACSISDMRTPCPICDSDECDTRLGACHHLFHWNCLLNTLGNASQNKDCCPRCTRPIQSWHNTSGGIWMNYSQ